MGWPRRQEERPQSHPCWCYAKAQTMLLSINHEGSWIPIFVCFQWTLGILLKIWPAICAVFPATQRLEVKCSLDYIMESLHRGFWGRFFQISIASHSKGDLVGSGGHCHPSNIHPLSDAELCGVSMQHLIRSHIWPLPLFGTVPFSVLTGLLEASAQTLAVL